MSNDFVAPLIPLLREEPGLNQDSSLAQNGKAQTDEIRRLFREFRAVENTLPPKAAADAGRAHRSRSARRSDRRSSPRWR